MNEMIIRAGMATSTVTLLPGLPAVAALHAAELPQKDNLCGCFWGAIALRAAGLEGIDQDRVAQEAGTSLPEGDPSTFVPAGEKSRQDYTVELPRAVPSSSSGTAASALAQSVVRLSEGKLAAVPVAGPWGGDMVLALISAVAETAPATMLVANIRTGALWGSRPHPGALLAYLQGVDVEGPPPDWDVGHFVNLAAVFNGPARSLVLVRDSYRSLGADGHHLQPAEAVAAALQRGDGREGGALCLALEADADALRARLTSEGFELRDWENGTPA
jgi:hypothetical protein